MWALKPDRPVYILVALLTSCMGKILNLSKHHVNESYLSHMVFVTIICKMLTVPRILVCA